MDRWRGASLFNQSSPPPSQGKGKRFAKQQTNDDAILFRCEAKSRQPTMRRRAFSGRRNHKALSEREKNEYNFV